MLVGAAVSITFLTFFSLLTCNFILQFAEKRVFEKKTMQNMHGVPLGHPASVASAGQPPPHSPTHAVGPPGGHPGNPELSFEDFTSMSPFLDPAALHGLNPYASSLASSAKK